MENTQNNKFINILAILVIGLGVGYFFGNNSTYPQANMHMMRGGEMMDNSRMGMGTAMENMMSGLNGLSGDAFDKAFLTEMIMHHEGAVVMAEAALKDAKHQEIKDLASAIITAQNQEISQMKGWLSGWYK